MRVTVDFSPETVGTRRKWHIQNDRKKITANQESYNQKNYLTKMKILTDKEKLRISC